MFIQLLQNHVTSVYYTLPQLGQFGRIAVSTCDHEFVAKNNYTLCKVITSATYLD